MVNKPWSFFSNKVLISRVLKSRAETVPCYLHHRGSICSRGSNHLPSSWPISLLFLCRVPASDHLGLQPLNLFSLKPLLLVVSLWSPPPHWYLLFHLLTLFWGSGLIHSHRHSSSSWSFHVHVRSRTFWRCSRHDCHKINQWLGNKFHLFWSEAENEFKRSWWWFM